MKLFPVILVLLLYYYCNVTDSNYKFNININIQSHNRIVNSKTSTLESSKLFNAIGKRRISDLENNPINKGCNCNRKGECKPKGCKLRRASSRSIAG